MERLGYGTHLTVDAFQAQQSRLADTEAILELLGDMARAIETSCDEEFMEARVDSPEGLSAARLCSESQFFIHLFPERSTLSFRVFTRRNATLAPLLDMLRQYFGTGRFESHISSVSKLAARETAAIEEMLVGDRSYALARFGAVSSEH